MVSIVNTFEEFVGIKGVNHEQMLLLLNAWLLHETHQHQYWLSGCEFGCRDRRLQLATIGKPNQK